jgi:DNA replication and repair protein RecF
MAFNRIQLRNFRNLEDGAVETGASSIFLVGENGQGKSNFLDALYTLSYGSSFRGSQDTEAARLGESTWALEGQSYDAEEGHGGARSGLFSVRWENGLKSIRENGKPISDRKRLVENNPSVIFCHDDMEFARGEPERRRFFFDQTAGLVSAGYIDHLRSYRKTLRARNAALKERMISVLDVLDLQLARYGTALREERVRIVAFFDQIFALRYEAVSLLGRRISVQYRPSWKPGEDYDAVLARLAAARERELSMGTTMSGPHRDRYVFSDEHGDFSSRASTGQLRLLALTLRIAQAEHYSAMSGREPVLLLDDVLLELDPDKRRRFMENLPKGEQAFFTFLPGEPYGDYRAADTLVYWTDHGRFTHT